MVKGTTGMEELEHSQGCGLARTEANRHDEDMGDDGEFSKADL
jgi:hypothetical protein